MRMSVIFHQLSKRKIHLGIHLQVFSRHLFVSPHSSLIPEKKKDKKYSMFEICLFCYFLMCCLNIYKQNKWSIQFFFTLAIAFLSPDFSTETISGASRVIDICFIPCLNKLHAYLKSYKKESKYIINIHQWICQGNMIAVSILYQKNQLMYHSHVPDIDSGLHFVPGKYPYLYSSLCKLVYAFRYLKWSPRN